MLNQPTIQIEQSDQFAVPRLFILLVIIFMVIIITIIITINNTMGSGIQQCRGKVQILFLNDYRAWAKYLTHTTIS